MIEFFRAGGFGMWVVLAFGLLTLGSAGHFALRADRKSRSFVEAMSRVVGFSTLAALVTDLGAVFNYVTTHALPGEKFRETLCEGLKESLAPVIMGSAFLMLIWLFVAVGQRRLDARSAAA